MFKPNCSLFGSIKKVWGCSRGATSLQGAVSASFATEADPSGTTETSGATETSGDSAKDFSWSVPLPGQDSHLRWAGQTFNQLPIAHIKATYNNTHVQVTDSAGLSLVRTSCGTEGFKNAKKSTPIAAQTAGQSAAMKASAKGVTFVRVLMKGLGPGRLVSTTSYSYTSSTYTSSSQSSPPAPTPPPLTPPPPTPPPLTSPPPHSHQLLLLHLLTIITSSFCTSSSVYTSSCSYTTSSYTSSSSSYTTTSSYTSSSSVITSSFCTSSY
ncbi:hypothetical protein CRUP_017448 [Coryphaenoides rupestris]|nr:hypothetical protein CRUP_017448 [Coryphaenoides rupestris]